jgi:hypothetical protein
VLIAMALGSFTRAQSTTSTSSTAVRFAYVDVMIDPKGESLAAYQIDLAAADPRHVKLVGVEGGDAAAYREPPYYDPAALNHDRVIIAAFSTASDVPKSKFRAARLHLQITGDETPKWETKPVVASSAKSDKIQIDVTLSEGAAK